jgi:Uma2 family endonuclease
VIEILSPTTAGRDRGVKRKLYARQGVAEYWIVDPESESLEVWTFGDGEPSFARLTGRVPVRLGGEELGAIDLARVFRAG